METFDNEYRLRFSSGLFTPWESFRDLCERIANGVPKGTRAYAREVGPELDVSEILRGTETSSKTSDPLT